jgi:integrase-like protein
VVEVGLVGVRHARAVVGHVGHAVTVEIGLAGVADVIAVGVALVEVGAEPAVEIARGAALVEKSARCSGFSEFTRPWPPRCPTRSGRSCAPWCTAGRTLVYEIVLELDAHWNDVHDVERDISEYIDAFYNSQRRHSHNQYLSPVDFESQFLQQGIAA